MKPRTPYDPAALRRPSLAAVCPPAKGFEVQERLIARATPGGERVRGSGCSTRPGRKGDVRGDLTLNEGKTTAKASITIERAWLAKIKVEAADVGLCPAFTLGFDAARPSDREDWKAYPLGLANLLESIAAAILAGDLDGAREMADRVPARNNA